jgi:type IV secretion system protein VirB4
MFTGRLTLLVLDEAWLFLKHPIFAAKIEEWLKTLRKKSVFVVFATQDVSDAVHSSLCSTIIQQCHTKIFLADPEAQTPAMSEAYSTFGLSDAEIDALSHAVMKRDYLYTSTLGSRMFQLDLGKVTLALIGSPNHEILDTLAQQHADNPNYEYGEDILKAKKCEFSHLILA